jgi:hypothetical protein
MHSSRHVQQAPGHEAASVLPVEARSCRLQSALRQQLQAQTMVSAAEEVQQASFASFVHLRTVVAVKAQHVCVASSQ